MVLEKKMGLFLIGNGAEIQPLERGRIFPDKPPDKMG